MGKQNDSMTDIYNLFVDIIFVVFQSRLHEHDLDILQDVRSTSCCHNNSKLHINCHLHLGKLSHLCRVAEK